MIALTTKPEKDSPVSFFWKYGIADPFRDDEDSDSYTMINEALRVYIIETILDSVPGPEFPPTLDSFWDDIRTSLSDSELMFLAREALAKFLLSYKLHGGGRFGVEFMFPILTREDSLSVLEAISYFERDTGLLREFVYPIWNGLLETVQGSREEINRYFVTYEVDKTIYNLLRVLVLRFFPKISSEIIRSIFRTNTMNRVIFIVLEKIRCNILQLNALKLEETVSSNSSEKPAFKKEEEG